MKINYKSLYCRLMENYDADEAKALTWWVLEEITGRQRYEIMAEPNIELSDAQSAEMENCVLRLMRYEPVQYVFGKMWWRGMDLRVSPSVLIPRPETAQIIDLVYRAYGDSPVQVLDIGTGSGCLALGLKKCMPSASVAGVDISELALKVARQNAGINGLNVDFFQCDLLSDTFLESMETRYDIIVSNPPYIMESEKGNMDSNVLDFEPHIALFVPDNDPLIFYRAIARFAADRLKEGGMIVVEINQKLGNETMNLFADFFPCGRVDLIKDDYLNDRFIRVVRL